MRSIVNIVFVIAFIAVCEFAVVQLHRVTRQFGGLSPFGPTRGPPPPFGGPFNGPAFFHGNFPGFGPPGGPPPNFGQPPINYGGPQPNFIPVNRGGTGFNIPSRSGNIITRQANNPQRRRQQQLLPPQLLPQQLPQQQPQRLPQQLPQQLQQQLPQQQPQQQQVAGQQQVNRNSPSFKKCMADCQTTNEYNPVCGNDQQDYYNEQRLKCANRCGITVQTVRRGTCNITNN